MSDSVTTAPTLDTTKTLTAEAKGRTGAARILLGRDAIMIYLLLAFVTYASIAIPRFATPVTVGFLLLDVVPVLLIAMPMTLVIITGEIDLSVASIAGLTSALMGVLWADGLNIVLVLVIGLLVGVLAGAFNGFLIAVVGLPSLAVTIGTLALYRGLALVVIGDNAVADFPIGLTTFFTSKLGATGIPTVMIGVLAAALFFGTLLHFTPFGRGLYALGYSTEAARFVGIKVAHYRGPDWTPIERGVEAGTIANIPVMIDFGEFRLERPFQELVLKKLRPGDIYTHAFYAPVPMLDEQGRLLPYLFEARKRGILFDVGHGGAAFEFRQAVPAVKQGFPPDSISTDVHSGSINAGMKDQLNVMSKFLNMGMPLRPI